MTANKEKIIFKELSYKAVGLAMEVHKKLGYGFLEKVYENAMMILLEKEGIHAEQQVPISVYFEEKIVGEYFADILVDNKIILELKASDNIIEGHRAQMLNYLRATNIPLGIIINFGRKRLEYERVVN